MIHFSLISDTNWSDQAKRNGSALLTPVEGIRRQKPLGLTKPVSAKCQKEALFVQDTKERLREPPQKGELLVLQKIVSFADTG